MGKCVKQSTQFHMEQLSKHHNAKLSSVLRDILRFLKECILKIQPFKISIIIFRLFLIIVSGFFSGLYKQVMK